ncbi:hypothetical protein Y032_0695g1596, partial [Ancylostoma ceylanicum]
VCPRNGNELEQLAHIGYDEVNHEHVTLGFNYGEPIPKKRREVSTVPRLDYGLIVEQRPGADQDSSPY